MRLFRARPEFIEKLRTRRFGLRRSGLAQGKVSAQKAAPLVQIGDLRARIRRTIERAVAGRVIRDRDLETGTKILDGLFGKLLLLMGGVAAFNLAQSIALDGFRQDKRRSSLVLGGRLIGVVNLQRIMAAAVQASDLLVGHVINELRGFRIAAGKFLAHVGPAPRLERLIIAIHTHSFINQLDQASRSVGFNSSRSQSPPQMHLR